MPRKLLSYGVPFVPSAERNRRPPRRKSSALLFDWLVLEDRWCPSQVAPSPGAAPAMAAGEYGQLPLAFEPNLGQAGPSVD